MSPLRFLAVFSVGLAPACFAPTESLTGNGSNDDGGSSSGDTTTDGDAITTTTADPPTTDPTVTGMTADPSETSPPADGSSGGLDSTGDALDSTGDAPDSTGDATSDTPTTEDPTTGNPTTEDPTDDGSTTVDPPTCGDGLVEGDELCDDGNATDDDGCTACAVDANHLCTDEPSACGPICDPLLQDCFGIDGCYPAPEGWLCLGDTSGVGGLEDQPCETLTDCNPGLVCLGVESVPDCVGDACCTRLCDTTDPGGCGGGLDCVVLAALPDADHVAACVPGV